MYINKCVSKQTKPRVMQSGDDVSFFELKVIGERRKVHRKRNKEKFRYLGIPFVLMFFLLSF